MSSREEILSKELNDLQKELTNLRERYRVCSEMMKGCQESREFVAYRKGLRQIDDEIWEVEQKLKKLKERGDQNDSN